LMLGTDKSRGYCSGDDRATSWREPIWRTKNSEVLLQSALRFFKFLPGEERKMFLD
jgi:hypothetical protein